MKKTTKQKQSRLTEAEMCERLEFTKGQLRRLHEAEFIPKPKNTNKGQRYELNDDRRIAAGLRPVGMMQRLIVGGEA